MTEAVGKRLQQLRLAKDFDYIRHFAEAIGVNEARYDKWEKGRALVPPEVVLRLKAMYGITADWLYYGEESGLTVSLAAELRGTPEKRKRA